MIPTNSVTNPTKGKETMTQAYTQGLQVGGSLTLGPEAAAGASALLNDRRLALLEHIGSSGSISQAAKLSGFSYKGAWDAVDAMNSLFGVALVVTMTGGKGGGGAQLTETGIRVVDASRVLRREHQKFLAAASAGIADFDNIYTWMRRLTVRTSARNQFFGKVVAIKQAQVNVEVTLQLAGGDQIHAVITNDGLNELGLQIGSEAWALVKASWMILATPSAASGLSVRNKLAGEVIRVHQGGVNAEVSLRCAGGNVLSATLTNDSVAELQIAEGKTMVAVFKASSVIMGVTD